MANLYKYNVYCLTENDWVATPNFSETEPTVCPNNAGHSIGTIIQLESTFTEERNILMNFSQNLNGYIQTNVLGTWTNINFFWYEGTNHVKPIKRIIAIVSRNGNAEGTLEFYISGTSTVLATLNWTSGTINTPAKVETVSISNLPSTGSIIGIRFQRSGGLLDNIQVHNISFIYI